MVAIYSSLFLVLLIITQVEIKFLDGQSTDSNVPVTAGFKDEQTPDSDTLQWLHAMYGGLGPVMNSPLNHLAAIIPDAEPDPRPIPEQIHLAYGDNPTEMVVLWSTPSPAQPSVLYGVAPGNWSLEQKGTSEYFVYGNSEGLKYLHRVKLKNLIPGSKYSFKVQTNAEKSALFTFKAMADGQDWSPVLLIYGDMGTRGGAASLRLLNREVSSGNIDAIIHVGDFGYDLHDDGGKVGDDFMNRIQSLATKVPYMAVVGNHEIAHDFSHYRYRFSMPHTDWPIPLDKMWYSFDMAQVHFVIYSTEVYFTNGPIEQQYEWLLQDLIQANQNRDKQPWVIAQGHRPMYCSNTDNDDCTYAFSRVRSGLEDLFHSQGVDVIMQAHEHSYERLWPMINKRVTARHYNDPKAPVHIINGAAGCNEYNGVCVNPMLGPINSWSAFRAWLPGLYSYGKLSVANSTHIHWQQILSVNNQVMDDIWIVQHHHQPFEDEN